QYLLWMAFLQLAELIQPGVEGAIGDELDVFETHHHLVVLARLELGVAGRGVDDLAGIEANRLADHAAPAELVRLGDYLRIRSGGPRGEQKGIFELNVVYRRAQ